ncbi:hypothetical protein HBO23_00215 [Pseudomonas sp. WS 5532]|uniref:hypothetical protein n=1 Tax=Pseudomonas sp. WS 5532 TaxID=2717495 RepID=UPI001473D546|nr:hypothetical protein [Pseudomonas sp. WS 5532]NMX71373.1 hypothetical protein [Pseudomonas sp. WS 5532]
MNNDTNAKLLDYTDFLENLKAYGLLANTDNAACHHSAVEVDAWAMAQLPDTQPE